jgi:hypothetical protein
MYHYLATGKGPEELKDYYFPKTGQLDEQGRPQRASLPTYVKDLYHYATAPGKTITGKASPIVSLVADMIRNQDFYGTKIRNEDDPLIQQLKDSGKFVASQMVPMSVRNLQREADLGAPLAQRAQQFFGITPAPSELERTPAERRAQEIVAARIPAGGRTADQAEHSRLRAELTRSLRLRQGIPSEVAAARTAGKLNAKDYREAAAGSRLSPLQRSVQHLGLEDTLSVYREANESERRILRPLVVKKAKSALKNATPDERSQLLREMREALAK